MLLLFVSWHHSWRSKAEGMTLDMPSVRGDRDQQCPRENVEETGHTQITTLWQCCAPSQSCGTRLLKLLVCSQKLVDPRLLALEAYICTYANLLCECTACSETPWEKFSTNIGKPIVYVLQIWSLQDIVNSLWKQYGLSVYMHWPFIIYLEMSRSPSKWIKWKDKSRSLMSKFLRLADFFSFFCIYSSWTWLIGFACFFSCQRFICARQICEVTLNMNFLTWMDDCISSFKQYLTESWTIILLVVIYHAVSPIAKQYFLYLKVVQMTQVF